MLKTVVLVWKCLYGTAPGYLSELCVPVASASGRQHLRSASTGLLQVPRARIWSAGGASLSQDHLCETVFLLLYRDQRWLCTLSRDNWRSICSTSDVLWTEGTFTTARRCCGVFVILAPDTKLQTYLLTCRIWKTTSKHWGIMDVLIM